MRRRIDIIAAIRDPRLIADREISSAQETLIRACYGLPLLTDEQQAIFKRATGRSEYVPRSYRDISVLAGRRSGKSTKICANIAIFEACIAKHPIPAHERGRVLVMAPTEKQAAITFAVILSKLQKSVTLSSLVVNARASMGERSIELSNGIDIVVAAANAKHVRGAIDICVVLEEAAFFRDSETGAYNLAEIIKAIRPGMLTVPDAKLIRVSSPWSKSGPMWDDVRLRDERPDTLSWKLPSWEMNPALPAPELALERERDVSYFEREFGCEFVDIEEQFLSAADVDASIRKDTREVPAVPNLKYFAAIDASGLGGRDRFAFMVGHQAGKGQAGVGLSLDCVRFWSREAVAAVCDEIKALCAAYRIKEAAADQFGIAFLSELLRIRGISLKEIPFTSASKGEIFIGMKTQFAQQQIQLLDIPQLRRELVFLESRKTGSGGFTVSAPRSEHDDLACCLGLLAHAAKKGMSNSIGGFVATAHGVLPDPRPNGKPQLISPDNPKFWPSRGLR